MLREYKPRPIIFELHFLYWWCHCKHLFCECAKIQSTDSDLPSVYDCLLPGLPETNPVDMVGSSELTRRSVVAIADNCKTFLFLQKGPIHLRKISFSVLLWTLSRTAWMKTSVTLAKINYRAPSCTASDELKCLGILETTATMHRP